jgi:hypothetical protein
LDSPDGTVSPLSRRSVSPVVLRNSPEDARMSRTPSYPKPSLSRMSNPTTMGQAFRHDPIPTPYTNRSSASLSAYPPQPSSNYAFSTPFQASPYPFRSDAPPKGHEEVASNIQTPSSSKTKRFLGLLRHGRKSMSDGGDNPSSTPGIMFSLPSQQARPSSLAMDDRGHAPDQLSRQPVEPPSRSSIAMGDLRILEGLLDPRLELMNLESTASFGDHEDYSRPFKGLVHNRLNSTTTLSHEHPIHTPEGSHHAL